ncbi:dihydrodipicolinate synthase family protein [Jiangella endophytica]|uniref:dihydrodipicolinate synthase family protein n=1 Tax=Jiangella endophytica TaxID=1623398 RepID=UPI0018E503C7|nr:dihydrodipicolinate synthase family protein [Jiangella endophytica]
MIDVGSSTTDRTAPDGGEPPAPLIAGISPVLEVPFTENGDVDLPGFDRLVRHVLSTGVTSVMFPGFASEFYKLTEDERTTLVDRLLTHTAARPGVSAIVAIQDHATRLAVERARRVVAAGADAINLLPPHFLAPSREALIEHIAAVCAAVAPVPVVLQYAPKETATFMSAADIAAVARRHPNLAYVKVESSPPGALIGELLRLEPPIQAVEGYAGLQLPDAIRRGAVGSQPGCSFAEVYIEIWKHFEAGRDDEGDRLHAMLLPFISYWMQDTELIIAAEKLISVRRGLFASAMCREPAHHLDKLEIEMIDRFLSEFAALLPPVEP